MDEQLNPTPRPRRRRRTQMEIMKEAYLPYVFLLAAAVIIVIFIIGALIRNTNAKKDTSAGNSSELSAWCLDAEL